MKKIMTFFVIFFLIQSVYHPLKINAQVDTLSLAVSFSPEKVVSPGSTLTLRCMPREYCIISVFLVKTDHLVALVESFELSPTMENEVEIPVTYPILTNFTLRVNGYSPDLKRKFTDEYAFHLSDNAIGPYRIRGRILQCSDIFKKGLEGAVVETISGPSYARTETEDDGYFSLEKLQQGQYKLKISHDCTVNAIEKIVWVDQETPFLEGCLGVYGLPDIDLWMNKPSGSTYEKEEMSIVYIRSSMKCLADLYITDLSHKQLIFSQLNIPEEQLIQYYWKIPTNLHLGKYFLYLQPRETKLCGKAQTLFEVKSGIRTGTVRGSVTIEGKPIQGVEVYLPLQFMDPVLTDSFGKFEIQNIQPGLHTIRARKTGFIQMDKYGVEVKNGLVTEGVHIPLLEDEPLLRVSPEKIRIATHERMAVECPIQLQLDQGFCKDISLELIGAPAGITLSAYTIPSLLQEKRILTLQVSETIEPNEYDFTVQVKSEKKSLSIDAKVVVSGLSIGTFDVIARPYKQSVSVGEEAIFELDCSKFTNFSKPIQFTPLDLPDYWECKFTPDSILPPSQARCSIIPSLSVKPGLYRILIRAKADNQEKIIPIPIEVLPAGGHLLISPITGWQPIIEPGSSWEFPLVFSSAKGVTENVMINVDFGPSWMKISNREIGSLDHQSRSSSILFNPGSGVGTGGYDYAISFTFGTRNEGYQKLSGRIYVLQSDPFAPTNLRSKLIEEENRIQLTWGPPAKNALDVVGYNVYKSLHYPNIESTYPMNSSLIRERNLIDQDFKAGKTYWYIVKAVYSDGTISKKSNTAEITVLPYETVTNTITLAKGENSTYYSGKLLPFSFFSTVSGSVSFSLLTPNLKVLLFQTTVQAMQTEFYRTVTPSLTGEVVLETVFISHKGTRQVSTSSLRIQESYPGDDIIQGILWNSLYDTPVSEAWIETWEGPTLVKTISDESGAFSLSGLSKGTYRFIITKNQHKTLTEEIHVPSKQEPNPLWDCAWESNASFLFWSQLETKKTTDLHASIPLFFKSEVDQDVSLQLTSGFVTKTLITQLHLDKNKTRLERIQLPEEVPSGQIILSAMNTLTMESESFSLSIERNDPEGSVYWQIRDPFGNPLPGCKVNDTVTNEWGYFYLPILPAILNIAKYGYEPKAVETEGMIEDYIQLSYQRRESVPVEKELFIAKDFNDLNLHFYEQEGMSQPFTIQLYLADFDKEGNEKAVFKMDSVVLFPGYIYQLLVPSIDYNAITEASRIELTYTPESKISIPIKKGNEELISLETDPEFLFVKPGSLLPFEIDLFSQGSFKKPLKLEIDSSDPDIKIKLSSQSAHPGTILNGSLLITQEKPSRTLQIRISIWLEAIQVGQTVLSFTLTQDRTIESLEKQWVTMLYKGDQSNFNVYFNHTEKPVSVSVPSTLPVTCQISAGVVHFQAKPVETGLTSGIILITMPDDSVVEFPIQTECIEKDPWLIPTLTAENKPEGISLSVQNLPKEARYKINRIKQIQGSLFLQTAWLEDPVFMDTALKQQTVYTYRVFAFNGRLESDWSNTVSKFRNPLSLTVNITDGMITNKRSIEVRGSTNGSFLFINERSIRLDAHGAFTENILLKVGENTLHFLIKDDYGNQLEETRKVVVDSQSPVISLLQPDSLLYETILSQITIQLSTNEPCILSMNQQTVKTEYRTEWKLTPALDFGKQTFQFVAVDKANNQSKLDLVVVRYKTMLTIELAIDRNLAVVNGKSFALDAPPVILQGRTMVPLRFIGEAFGAKVDWKAATKEINITLDSTQLMLQIGQKTAYINKKTIQLDSPPVIMQGRTMVPLRFIGEAFGAKVDWIAKTKEIKISLKR